MQNDSCREYHPQAPSFQKVTSKLTQAAAKKAKKTGDESFSKEDVTRYLQEEIERRNQSINQKLATIEQLQREITAEQQQITECNFVLGQLEIEE